MTYWESNALHSEVTMNQVTEGRRILEMTRRKVVTDTYTPKKHKKHKKMNREGCCLEYVEIAYRLSAT